MAASNLLGVGDINITSYISPTSAASTIQYAYRHHIIRRNCCIIPCLRVTEKSWAADSNAYYRSTLASMYQKWAHLTFAALVSYLTDLRRLHFTAWPHMSSDYETMLWEYEVREISDVSWALEVVRVGYFRETCFLTEVFFFRSSLFCSTFVGCVRYRILFFWILRLVVSLGLFVHLPLSFRFHFGSAT